MTSDEKIAKLEKEIHALKRKVKAIEERMTMAVRTIDTINYLQNGEKPK